MVAEVDRRGRWLAAAEDGWAPRILVSSNEIMMRRWSSHAGVAASDDSNEGESCQNNYDRN